MNLEISLKELRQLINCMDVADSEFGPLKDKNFYKLLKKLRELEKKECQSDHKKNSER